MMIKCTCGAEFTNETAFDFHVEGHNAAERAAYLSQEERTEKAITQTEIDRDYTQLPDYR